MQLRVILLPECQHDVVFSSRRKDVHRLNETRLIAGHPSFEGPVLLAIPGNHRLHVFQVGERLVSVLTAESPSEPLDLCGERGLRLGTENDKQPGHFLAFVGDSD